jgi:hypothetical protein
MAISHKMQQNDADFISQGLGHAKHLPDLSL